MKILKRIKSKYKSLKQDEVTSRRALWHLLKYIYINIRLYQFNQEVVILFYNKKIKARVKKGDGIAANYHSVFHEPVDTIFLINYLNSSDHLIDIGANVGHFSLVAAKIAKCKVMAIEPIPETFSRLTKNVALNELNELVDCRNIGLSNESGSLHFSDNLNTTNKVISEGRKGVEIAVHTLDDLTAKLSPTILKIDVEGYEYFVLKGGLKTLNSDSLKVIIVELNESSNEYGVDEELIIELLKEYSFKPISFSPSVNNITELKNKDTSKFNTIFTKDIKHVSERIKSNNYMTNKL